MKNNGNGVYVWRSAGHLSSGSKRDEWWAKIATVVGNGFGRLKETSEIMQFGGFSPQITQAVAGTGSQSHFALFHKGMWLLVAAGVKRPAEFKLIQLN